MVINNTPLLFQKNNLFFPSPSPPPPLIQITKTKKQKQKTPQPHSRIIYPPPNATPHRTPFLSLKIQAFFILKLLFSSNSLFLKRKKKSLFSTFLNIFSKQNPTLISGFSPPLPPPKHPRACPPVRNRIELQIHFQTPIHEIRPPSLHMHSRAREKKDP